MSKPTASRALAALAEFLASERSNLVARWLKCLRPRWGRRQPAKTKLLTAEIEQELDLLTLLGRELRNGIPSNPADYDSILGRLRSNEYAISDFHQEVHCLEEVVAAVWSERAAGLPAAKVLGQLRPFRERLHRLARSVIQATADVVECAVEHGGRAFCQAGRDGNIVFANAEMRRLAAREALTGQPACDLFDGEERSWVRDLLTGRQGRRPRLRGLSLTRADGSRVPVAAELAPVFIDGQRVGGYLSLTNITEVKRQQEQIFEHSLLGVIQVDRNRRIVYANPKVKQILGTTDVEGRDIVEFFPDPKNKATLRRKLRERFARGASDRYEAELTRADGCRVPVEIAASPMRDPQGHPVGSVGIIRSLAPEKGAKAISESIMQTADAKEFLSRLTEALRAVLPFDMITVSVYSTDMKRVRAIWRWSADGRIATTVRYWEISPFVRKWMTERDNSYIPDLGQLLAQPGWQEVQQDPAVRNLLERQLTSVVFYPVFAARHRLAGAVAIFRKGVNKFTDEDVNTVKALPLDKAVFLTLYLEELRRLELRSDLMRDILARCHDMKGIAVLLTERLAKRYEWPNVSIFAVNEFAGQFELLGQAAHGEHTNFLLREDYTQPLSEGMLAQARQRQHTLNIGDIRADPVYSRYYVQQFERGRSELAVPMLVDGRVFWILNVEDSKINAFSPEEVADLELLLTEVAQILHKARLSRLFQATIESASDAIIVTDERHRICQANPAVQTMLGYAPGELAGKSVRKLFDTRARFERIVADPATSCRETELTAKSVKSGSQGTQVPVLLSVSRLPEELGGRVFLARDQSMTRRLVKLEHLETMYREVATQMKTPLALATAWLRRSRAQVGEGPMADVLGKTIEQLHKIDLTYDRLALYDFDEEQLRRETLLLNLEEVLRHVQEALPEADRRRLAVQSSPGLPDFEGDMFQLTFCVESILAYLLRWAPPDEPIQANAHAEPGRVVLRLAANVPPPPESRRATDAQPVDLPQILADMSLGENLIQRFAQNHNGHYRRRYSGRRAEFTLSFATPGTPSL